MNAARSFSYIVLVFHLKIRYIFFSFAYRIFVSHNNAGCYSIAQSSLVLVELLPPFHTIFFFFTLLYSVRSYVEGQKHNYKLYVWVRTLTNTFIYFIWMELILTGTLFGMLSMYLCLLLICYGICALTIYQTNNCWKKKYTPFKFSLYSISLKFFA